MKLKKAFLLSYVSLLMILFSMVGLISREANKKIFYLPIGLMGISIISEKLISRKVNRQIIVKKIKSYQNRK